MKSANYNGMEVAVIGMAVKFPGANNISEFWNNLKNGVESIQSTSDEELRKEGINEELINNPNYVKTKGGVIDNKEFFDNDFFGYIPNEAILMDPQIRIFHECAWEALENAGYYPENYKGLIGLYAGASSSFPWETIVKNMPNKSQSDGFSEMQLVNKDFLSTRIGYKLNLKGPCYSLQTACSTSLVTVHTGVRALLTNECHIALAGGITIFPFRRFGYLYKENMILSKDGHCRSFDEKASGTIFSEGVGIVVLKKLENALKDKDHIYAIIKSTAINNDGNRKVGYSAPSVMGQTEVIRAAQRVGKINPETISYIEAHGTATSIGDPIEIEALNQAFNTEKRNFCAVGSVKSNIGHLDTAAGIAGFIKTVLMLYNKKFVPSLHFERPNPKIDFKNSPFYINTEYKDWGKNDYPRRAGVSSFGIGGTNAHAILEEAPEDIITSGGRKYKMIMLSAKTTTALDKATHNLADFIKDQQNINIADIAYNLQVGRKPFNQRRLCVCSDAAEAAMALSNTNENKVYTNKVKENNPFIVFMFPGQGSQYQNMGHGLYLIEPFFRQKIDECCQIILPILGYDIKSILFSQDNNPKEINQTELTQPLLFIIEYSLAELLMHWGIKPNAMIGHSIGEYVAACLSGVLTLEEALKLVVTRGKLMQGAQPGSMLSVALPEEQIKQITNGEISLAAVNTNANCVLSGTHDAINKLESQLNEKNIAYRNLETSHAFHSNMMDPILDKFKEEIKKVQLNNPKIPYISNITGNWITNGQLEDKSYWANHLRNTVRFYDGICEISKQENVVFIEVGPGKSLSTLVKQSLNQDSKHKIFNLLRHPHENVADDYYFTTKLGQLWLNNIEINWEAYYSEEKRKRIPLPTYPFERQRYWIDTTTLTSSVKSTQNDLSKKEDIADWFYIPAWEQSDSAEPINIKSGITHQWLIFTDNNKLCNLFIKRLQEENQNIITVHSSSKFSNKNNKEFYINPAIEEDYVKLFNILKNLDLLPNKVLHLWNLNNFGSNNLLNKIDSIQTMGLYSLINISKAIGQNNINNEIQLDVITSNIHSITGKEEINPLQATLLGAIKVIPLESLNIRCRNIDIETFSGEQVDQIDQVLNEIKNENITNNIVGYRGNYRWLLNYNPIRLEKGTNIDTFTQEGVYLITGGFGGIGLTIAEHLAKNYKARLILINRAPFPDYKNWDKYLKENDKEDKNSLRILKLKELETFVAKVMVCSADVSDYNQMSKIIKNVKTVFGQITGVIHTAGLMDYAGKIQNRTRNQIEEILIPKVNGTIVLDKILKDYKIELFLNFSSLSTQVYDANYRRVGYAAANEFLDAFNYYKIHNGSKHIKTINWPTWTEVGMAYTKEKKEIKWKNVINPSEGIEVLNRSLKSKNHHIIVSRYTLKSLIQGNQEMNVEDKIVDENSDNIQNNQLKSRPELDTTYVAPRNEFEQKLTQIFENFFGYSQIGINDNFFELGGDSLKAINLLSKIHKEFNVKISLPEFFNNSTIAQIYNIIEVVVNPNKEVPQLVSNFINSSKAFYFGKNDQYKLFGIYNAADASKERSIGVVFCYPFGQEYIRCHRAYYNLEQELVINGYHTMRFDYSGCGDSDGLLEEAKTDMWLNDINGAIEEIKNNCKINKVILIGLRLGASLAAMYSEHNKVDGVVLWNPIFNGKDYLKELKLQHKKWLHGSFAKKSNLNPGILFESMGFPVSQDLSTHISKINIENISYHQSANYLLIDKFENKDCIIVKQNPQIEFKESTNQDFWRKDEEAESKNMLPIKDIKSIVKWLNTKY